MVVDGGDTSYIFTDLVENTPYDITVHGLARGIRKSLCSKEVSVKTPTTGKWYLAGESFSKPPTC